MQLKKKIVSCVQLNYFNEIGNKIKLFFFLLPAKPAPFHPLMGLPNLSQHLRPSNYLQNFDVNNQKVLHPDSKVTLSSNASVGSGSKGCYPQSLDQRFFLYFRLFRKLSPLHVTNRFYHKRSNCNFKKCICQCF